QAGAAEGPRLRALGGVVRARRLVLRARGGRGALPARRVRLHVRAAEGAAAREGRGGAAQRLEPAGVGRGALRRALRAAHPGRARPAPGALRRLRGGLVPAVRAALGRAGGRRRREPPRQVVPGARRQALLQPQAQPAVGRREAVPRLQRAHHQVYWLQPHDVHALRHPVVLGVPLRMGAAALQLQDRAMGSRGQRMSRAMNLMDYTAHVVRIFCCRRR
ncbi:unnamed protein product, partial [Prorocentrum cordatum]